MNKSFVKIGLLALFMLCGAYGVSMAADPLAQMPVKERYFQDLQPKGIRIGQFLVRPSLDTGVEYTTNALQTDANKQSDRILTVTPSIDVDGKLGNNDISMRANARQYKYENYTSQDRLNYDAGFTVQTPLSSAARLDTNLFAYQGHNRRLEEAGTLVDGAEPIQYNREGFMTDLILSPSKTTYSFGLGASQVSYDNTRRLSDNAVLVQNDRNRNEYTATAGFVHDAGLRFKPSFGLRYTHLDYDRRNYENGSGYTGVVQDRQRFAALAGVELLPLGKWRGRAQVGVGYEITDDSSLDNQTTNLIDIDLTYLYTPLTNFNVEFERFFTDDTNAAQGAIETRLAASVVHELTRQWLVSAGVSYDWRDFQNGADDETLSAFLSGDYKLNDQFMVGGGIEFIDRESNRRNGDFSETKAMIRLKSAF